MIFLLPILRYYISDELEPEVRVVGVKGCKTTLLSLCSFLGLKVKKNLDGREEMVLEHKILS